MIFRFFRNFSTSGFKTPGTLKEDWDSRLRLLSDVNLYSKSKVQFVIRSLYYIHSGSRIDKVKKDWNASPEISFALTSMIQHIPILDQDLTVLFIRNISNLGVSTHSIWEPLEQHLLDNYIKTLNSYNVLAVVQSISYVSRKNSSLWQPLEEITLRLLQPINTFEPPRLCGLLAEFKKNRKGSDELFKAITKELVSQSDDIDCFSALRVFTAYARENEIDSALQEVLVKAIVINIGELEGNNLKVAVVSMMRYGCSNKDLDAIEREIVRKFETLSLLTLSGIIFAYTEFRMDEILPGGRRNALMKEFENLYYLKRQNFAMILGNMNKDSKLAELKLMWALWRAGAVIHRDMWKKYLKVLESSPELKVQANTMVTDIENAFKSS